MPLAGISNCRRTVKPLCPCTKLAPDPINSQLRQRYREGQEDQLGALGLVVNIIIQWNTLYINAALDQLAGEGYPINPEDVARLSPLVFEHINMLGRYAFSVPDSVVRGQLRPLRNPADALEDVA